MKRSNFGKPLCRAMMAVAIMLLSLQAMAYDFSYTHQGKTLYYKILTGGTNAVAVTYYSMETSNNHVSGEVVIPSSVEYNGTTYSVTSIGNSAFSRCSSLTSVTIPNSVTFIGNSAFYDCSSLTSVTIPNIVSSIENYAFYDCSSLTSVTIPNSVSSIGCAAFSNCSGLTSIDVALENTHYSSIDGVLYNYAQDILIQCPGAKTSVTIPNSVTSIGESAFSGCSGLTSVTIPNNVTSIAWSAFSNCSGLTSIDVASENTHYSSIDGVLYNYAQDTLIQCPGAKTSVTIPNSVTSIGGGAFYGCSGLISVTIGNNVTSIGDDAFYECSGLISVTIPNSVTSIGDYAFYGCSGLISVTIGNNVTSIGDDAFYECSGLISVTIPNSVTSIGDYAFYECSGLTSVTIGNSVTSIGDYAFYSCSSLTSIKCLANTPPSLDGTGPFYNISDTCTLTVPCGSSAAYTASDWNTYFAGRISEDLSFELSVSANDETYGNVAFEAQSCEVATITATPNEGYEFTGWNDGNTENPRTVTVTSDTAFMAIFTASGSSSLQEVNAKEFALYPNPAKSVVDLEFETLEENTLLQILDINGRRVRTLELKAGVETLRIDLGGLPKGVYTVMIGSTTKKLIVE